MTAARKNSNHLPHFGEVPVHNDWCFCSLSIASLFWICKIVNNICEKQTSFLSHEDELGLRFGSSKTSYGWSFIPKSRDRKSALWNILLSQKFWKDQKLHFSHFACITTSCHCWGCYQLLTLVLRVSMDSMRHFGGLVCLADFLICSSTGWEGGVVGLSVSAVAGFAKCHTGFGLSLTWALCSCRCWHVFW